MCVKFHENRTVTEYFVEHGNNQPAFVVFPSYQFSDKKTSCCTHYHTIDLYQP